MEFTRDASEGKLLSRGIPAEMKEYHLQLIRHYFLDEQIPPYRFSQYYICDINSLVEQFRQQLLKLIDCPDKPSIANDSNIKISYGRYQRMKSRVNLQLAEKILFF